MVENEIVVPVVSAELSGTLCLPEQHGVFPVVLMVHGSGNLDRNENTKGQKLNIFNTFAHYLVKKGIASFRYDKRGVGKSTGNYYSAGHYDLVNDALKCLEYLSKSKHCDKNAIFLLGHSEGSIIVPQISQKHVSVAGIIMLAPFIDRMETILLQQAGRMKKMASELAGVKSLPLKLYFKLFNPEKYQRKLIKQVNRTAKDTTYFLLQKIPAKWLRDLLSMSQSVINDIYINTSCPSLIVGGSKDIQCNPDDVESIKNIIQGSVESHVISDMTHILRPDSGKPSFFNYEELLKNPVETEVLNIVHNWIQKEITIKMLTLEMNDSAL